MMIPKPGLKIGCGVSEMTLERFVKDMTIGRKDVLFNCIEISDITTRLTTEFRSVKIMCDRVTLIAPCQPDTLHRLHTAFKTLQNGRLRHRGTGTVGPFSRDQTPEKIDPSDFSLVNAKGMIGMRISAMIYRFPGEETVNTTKKDVRKAWIWKHGERSTEV